MAKPPSIYIVSHVLYLSLFLITCNARAVVDKTVDIDGSIQMECIITTGRFIYIICDTLLGIKAEVRG